MDVAKLFHVLVVGGASLALGCAADEPESIGQGAANAKGTTGAGGATTAATGGSGGDATSAGGNGSAGGAATTGNGGHGGAGDGGAPALACSEPADAADACGCPCCWAEGCDNTDEACCGGFCDVGNNGAGCCGL